MSIRQWGVDENGPPPTTPKLQDEQEPWSSVPNSSGLMSLVAGVVIVVALYVAREILVPLTLAILLSFVLAPLVRLLRRARLGRIPAVGTAAILALFVILSLGGLIGTQVTQLITEIPRYATTIESKVAGLRSLVVGQVSGSVSRLGERIQRASSESAPPAVEPAPLSPPVIGEVKPIPVEIHQQAPTPLDIAERIVTPIIAPLSTMGIVFIVAIFILLQQADLRERFIRLFGLSDVHRTTTALDDAAERLSRYLLTLVVLNAAFGAVIWIGLVLIGVPNPLLWATLAGLFRFVPYIGAIISGAFPTALAAVVDPNWGMAIWTAGLFLVSETVMGQFVDPIVNGRSTGLSPVSVVVATIFWSWMWGPIGLILAMPLTVCLVVLGHHVQRLQFLEVLMGNKPALSPIESFYRRLLANDQDETLDYAEAYLKSQPLSAFYDDVAIMSLRLAAHDAERGVLTPLQLARIQREMARLLGELADKSDVIQISATSALTETAAVTLTGQVISAGLDGTGDTIHEQRDPRPDPQSILCISGRGVLDQPVAAMLAQMLDKNGLHASATTFESASRENIPLMDMSDVAMVCITYLELTGSPSHLRYLVRRIRHHVPHVPILVGLWPAEDRIALHDDRLRGAIDADHYTTSLRETVITCQTVAVAVNNTEAEILGSELTT